MKSTWLNFFLRFTWSKKKPPPTADAASFPTFWNKYPAHLKDTQESVVCLYCTQCFNAHHCSYNDLPASHSSNGQLCCNRVLLSSWSRLIFAKHFVPPPLFLHMLCQFHDIKGFSVCQKTVMRIQHI